MSKMWLIIYRTFYHGANKNMAVASEDAAAFFIAFTAFVNQNPLVSPKTIFMSVIIIV